MKLLIATRNEHKLHEIREIFDIDGLELQSVDDYSDLPEVEEDGSTFKHNAIKKAMTLAMIAKVWTLADDSGLEVAALGGAPGVYSARYAGEPADYQANNKKLMEEMKDAEDRRARFCCAIALSSPDGATQYVEGICPGSITRDERGENGFGYDPFFIPDGYDETFAEMDSELKNRISHRANALNKAWEKWEDLLKA